MTSERTPRRRRPAGARPALHDLLDVSRRRAEEEADPSTLWDGLLRSKLERACDDELDDLLLGWLATRMRVRGRVKPRTVWTDGRRSCTNPEAATRALTEKMRARRRWRGADGRSREAPAHDPPGLPELQEESALELYELCRGRPGPAARWCRILLKVEAGDRDAAEILWNSDPDAGRRPRLRRALERWIRGGRPPLVLGEASPGEGPR